VNVIVCFFIGGFSLFGTCYQGCGRFVEQKAMPVASLGIFASDLNRRGQRETRRKSSARAATRVR